METYGNIWKHMETLAQTWPHVPIQWKLMKSKANDPGLLSWKTNARCMRWWDKMTRNQIKNDKVTAAAVLLLLLLLLVVHNSCHNMTWPFRGVQEVPGGGKSIDIRSGEWAQRHRSHLIFSQLIRRGRLPPPCLAQLIELTYGKHWQTMMANYAKTNDQTKLLRCGTQASASYDLIEDEASHQPRRIDVELWDRFLRSFWFWDQEQRYPKW